MASGAHKSLVIKTDQLAADRLSEYEHGPLDVHVSDDAVGNLGEEFVDPAEVLAQARLEAEEKIREAYEEGLRRGIEAGAQQFAESVAASADALQAAAEQVEQARTQFLESLTPQVVQLVHAIAARVLRREAQTDPAVLETTARAALEKFLDHERLHIRLNPADLEGMRAQNVDLLERIDGVHEASLVSDEAVEAGGCVVESETLHVDAQLATQLQRILDALTEGADGLA